MLGKTELPQEIKTMADAHLSRRALLAGATGLGAAALIGGETIGAASAEAAGSTVRFGNWSLYLDYDNKTKTYPTLVDFTKKTGIQVKYMEVIDDNDSFTTKVTPQLRLKKDIGYDLVVPTEWMAARWLKAGFAQKLEAAAIPNKKNLISFLGKRDFDLNRDYTLPWAGVIAGLAWNKVKLPKGIQTLEDKVHPERGLFSNPALKGKIGRAHV